MSTDCRPFDFSTVSPTAMVVPQDALAVPLRGVDLIDRTHRGAAAGRVQLQPPVHGAVSAAGRPPR